MSFEFARMWPSDCMVCIPDRHEAAPFDLGQQEKSCGTREVRHRRLLPHDVAAVAVARCFGATTIERNPESLPTGSPVRKLPAAAVYNEVRSWLGKADNRLSSRT